MTEPISFTITEDDTLGNFTPEARAIILDMVQAEFEINQGFRDTVAAWFASPEIKMGHYFRFLLRMKIAYKSRSDASDDTTRRKNAAMRRNALAIAAEGTP